MVVVTSPSVSSLLNISIMSLSLSLSSWREEAALRVMIHYRLNCSATTTRARKLSVIVSQMHQVVVSPGML